MSSRPRPEPSDIARAVASSRAAENLVLAGAGTEFLFYIAIRDGRREGYRIARAPEFNTVNNQGVLALDLQVQEMALAEWASTNDIPSARPVELLQQDGFPVLVLDVVDDDSSALDSALLGAVVARMHQLPPPELRLVAQDGQPVHARVPERLAERYTVLRTDTELPPLPPVARMVSDLESHLGEPRLTHLDIRRQNVRVQRGQPLALFDWSNALAAPPELELARVHEYAAIADNGLDHRAFRTGYARAGGNIPTESLAWPILRLDTAVMLAVVFSSVAPDQELRRCFIDRVKGLVAQL